MNIDLECLPCFVNQVLKTCESVKLNEKITRRILARVLETLAGFESIPGTVLMAQRIQQILREETGLTDLFVEQKKQANQWMQQVLAGLFPSGQPDHFKQALQLAVAGNIIDLGALPELQAEQVTHTLENVEHAGFSIDHSAELESAACHAKHILYIGDNAGEIVFDKMLISMLPKERVTFATRGKPVLNDITLADALEVGMSEVAHVVDTGTDIPGVVLEECSDTFIRAWERSDLVIAKGQGNYESLCEDSSGKPIFFLFMVKCRKVADIVGGRMGDYIVLDNRLASARTQSEVEMDNPSSQ